MFYSIVSVEESRCDRVQSAAFVWKPRPNETCHHSHELLFCHINMPHFPAIVAVAVAVAVCTSFSAGGVNSNCWQQSCLGPSRGAIRRYRRLFPASLICMLLDTVECKVETAVLSPQWRTGRHVLLLWRIVSWGIGATYVAVQVWSTHYSFKGRTF